MGVKVGSSVGNPRRDEFNMYAFDAKSVFIVVFSLSLSVHFAPFRINSFYRCTCRNFACSYSFKFSKAYVILSNFRPYCDDHKNL